MSQLTLAEAVRAPLQTGEQTRYAPTVRAIVFQGQLHYYRATEHYRDWIEVFAYNGERLGSFRTLSAFLAEKKACVKPERKKEGLGAAAQALLQQTRPLVGRRIVAVQTMEEEGCSMPFTVFVLDDGQLLVVQSDPAGNNGGFPNVVKPTDAGGVRHEPDY